MLPEERARPVQGQCKALGGDWSRLRAWRPSPLVGASLVAHGCGVAALALQPGSWAHILALLAGNHAVLACGMPPRSRLLGPNLTRLPHGVALTFDDGPHPTITPRVLDMLDAHGARGTFFVIGERAARHGALLREMLRRGHMVENHTHRHPASFACWGPWRLRREIAAAQRAIADACGREPRFFRAPMGLRSPMLDPVLAAEGLALVSWTRRGYDTLSRRPDSVLRRLTRGLADGDILPLHDAPSRGAAVGRSMVLEVLPGLLAAMAALGLRSVSLPEEPGGAAGAMPARAGAPASQASA